MDRLCNYSSFRLGEKPHVKVPNRWKKERLAVPTYVKKQVSATIAKRGVKGLSKMQFTVSSHFVLWSLCSKYRVILLLNKILCQWTRSFTQPWSEMTFNCLNEKSAKRNVKHASLNYYRGGVVNQEDLYEALKKGEIWVRYKWTVTSYKRYQVVLIRDLVE